ncbi:MAG: hypothetical protein KF858_08665 [Candidatus Sumerlaeia bacterium]|nr:hypothetical protein [Candidatus Sumerlaeia bacterium]
MEPAIALWAGWTATLLASEAWHRRCLATIPHRFLITGMRGKTTATRLLHTGLLALDLPALGRTTGDAPMLHLPDSTRPWRRIGPANIREMRRVVRLAARLRCRALCVENMAIAPDLARLVATHCIRPTVCLHGYDTPDHLEHFAANPIARASQVAATIPPDCPVVLTDGHDDPRQQPLAEALAAPGRVLVRAKALDNPALPSHLAALAGAALAALEVAGLDANRARPTVEQLALDLRSPAVESNAPRAVHDFLSANDPQTTEALIRQHLPTGCSSALVYLHRRDRPARLEAFLPLLARHRSFLAGDPLPLTWRRRLPLPFLASPDDVQQIDADRIFLIGNAGGAAARWRGGHGLVERRAW